MPARITHYNADGQTGTRCREAIRWAHDENLCRSIEFRTTRFTCLREVAVEKRQPALCEEIADNGPLAVYEPPATMFRDTCFQNLAYAMHDRSQCAKVEDKQLRVSCEVHIP